MDNIATMFHLEPMKVPPYNPKGASTLESLDKEDLAAIIGKQEEYSSFFLSFQEVVPFKQSKIVTFINRAIKAKQPEPLAYPINPASHFIHNKLAREIQQPHEEFKSDILNNLLRHKIVREILSKDTSLTETDKYTIKSIFDRVYGGTVSYYRQKPTQANVLKLGRKFYEQADMAMVKIGCFIDGLESFISTCRAQYEERVLPSANTLKRLIRPFAPESAKSRGRSPVEASMLMTIFFKANKELIENFLM